MMNYIFIVVATSLWITGLQIAIQPTMLLYRPWYWLEDRWPGNPILSCRWCMPTLHTPLVMSILYFLLGEIHLPLKMLIGYYIVTVPASSFLAGLCFNVVMNTIPEDAPKETKDYIDDMVDESLTQTYDHAKFN